MEIKDLPAELKRLCTDYKFKIEQDDVNRNVIKVVFDDGKLYQIQKLTFTERHYLEMEENPSHTMFFVGLEKIFPMNDKSPAITLGYLEQNIKEGLELWSPLIRGCLRLY